MSGIKEEGSILIWVFSVVEYQLIAKFVCIKLKQFAVLFFYDIIVSLKKSKEISLRERPLMMSNIRVGRGV